MADTIKIPHPNGTAGVTVYAVQWGGAEDVVVAGAEVAFVAANWGTYARTCAEIGTSAAVYAFTPDAAVVASVVQATVYEQAGGSPAIGDPILAHVAYPVIDALLALPATRTQATDIQERTDLIPDDAPPTAAEIADAVMTTPEDELSTPAENSRCLLQAAQRIRNEVVRTNNTISVKNAAGAHAWGATVVPDPDGTFSSSFTPDE